MTDTSSVRLRAVELGDLPFTRKCRNDPSIHLPALGRRFPITEAGEEAWFRSLGQGSPPAEVTYVVAAFDGGDALGTHDVARHRLDQSDGDVRNLDRTGGAGQRRREIGDARR